MGVYAPSRRNKTRHLIIIVTSASALPIFKITTELVPPLRETYQNLTVLRQHIPQESISITRYVSFGKIYKYGMQIAERRSTRAQQLLAGRPWRCENENFPSPTTYLREVSVSVGGSGFPFSCPLWRRGV